MSDFSSYPGYVVARLGIALDIPTLVPGEIGFDVDTNNFRVGDGTPRPPKIPTDKSLGELDFSSSSKWTLPGGVVLDKTKPGSIDGVKIGDLNRVAGFLVRRNDNEFGAVSFTSTNKSLLIDNARGQANTLDIGVNPESTLLAGVIGAVVDLAFAELKKSLFVVSINPPANPALGMFWFDPEEGAFYARVSDGTTPNWIELSA